MIVRDAHIHDITRVVEHMRAEDIFEVYSGRFDKTPQALMTDLWKAKRAALGFLALCAEDGRAIALLAAFLEAPARASVLMVATDEWPEIARAATRYAIRKAIPAYLGGVKSAECRCWEGHSVSRRWLERLGFRAVATLPHHDENGSTVMLYRWLHPSCSASLSPAGAAAPDRLASKPL